jgi:hypothetical protein
MPEPARIIHGRRVELGAVLITVGSGLLAHDFVRRSGLGPAWWPALFSFFIGVAVAAMPDYRRQLETWRDLARLHLFVDDTSAVGL